MIFKEPCIQLIFTSLKDEKLAESFAANPGKTHYITPDISGSKSDFLRYCREKRIESILVEGGGKLYTWFLENQLADRIFLFYKPSFLGNDGIPIVDKSGVGKISHLKEFEILNVLQLENNILIELTKNSSFSLLEPLPG